MPGRRTSADCKVFGAIHISRPQFNERDINRQGRCQRILIADAHELPSGRDLTGDLSNLGKSQQSRNGQVNSMQVMGASANEF